MIKYFLSGFCLLIGFWAKSQNITIKDKETSRAIELVSIHSENPFATALTNARGQADFSAFKNSDSISFHIVGYELLILSYEQAEGLGFEIFMKPKEYSLDEIVIAATRWQQEKRDVPNKITSIKPESIFFQNPQTAADLLSFSNEVFVQKSQLGGGSPMIRGFATNRVLIAVDGVRMNNAIFRSGNLQNVISLDPFSIKNAEIVFGPGSVIYGSDAIGGVMSFYTLGPVFSSSDKSLIDGSVISRWSSANTEKTAHADFTVGLKRWSFITSLTFSDFGDLRMGKHGPDEYLRNEYASTINGIDTMLVNSDPLIQKPTGYNQKNLLQKISFKPSETWDIDYGLYYSTTSDYSRYDRHLRFRNGKQRSAEWYYGPQKWLMNTISISAVKPTALYDKVRLILAWQKFEESRHDRDFGDVIKHIRVEKVNAYSANLDLDKRIDNKHTLFYGLEILLNKVNSSGTEKNVANGTITDGPSRYPDGSVWNSYAAYVSYTVRWAPYLTLQTGLRYNQIHLYSEFNKAFYPFPFSEAKINTGALTGSAGIAWTPHGTWQINANFSSGFRSPNIDDVGKIFDSEPGAVVVPNPDLKPEYAWNFEIGVVKILANYLKVDISGYYTILDNAMVRRNFVLNGLDSIIYDGQLSRVQAIQNAAGANVYGVQAGLEVTLPAGISITSNFNYQNGEEELDDGSKAPLRHAAPWFGSTHIIWKWSRIKTDLYLIYNGEVSNDQLAPEEQGKTYIYAMDANGNPYSPGWYTLNLKIMWQIKRHLSFNAGIENLTSQRYRPYSSGIAGPGRNYIISVRANF